MKESRKPKMSNQEAGRKGGRSNHSSPWRKSFMVNESGSSSRRKASGFKQQRES
ncbi:MAG: hypothetical protein RPU15_08700 [Candidatus Sedimenticola sp. (ex Thyasira tokunagai)]